MGLECHDVGKVFVSGPIEKVNGAPDWNQHEITLGVKAALITMAAGYDATLKIFEPVNKWPELSASKNDVFFIDDAANEHHNITIVKTYIPVMDITTTSLITGLPNFSLDDYGTFDTGMYGACFSHDGKWAYSGDDVSGRINYGFSESGWRLNPAYTGYTSLPSFVNIIAGITNNFLGNRLIVIDNAGNLYEYSLTVKDDPTSAVLVHGPIHLPTLATNGGSTLSNGGYSFNVELSKCQKYLYVVNGTNEVHKFTFGASKEIDSLTWTEKGIINSSFLLRSFNISPDGKTCSFLYQNSTWYAGTATLSAANDVSGFTINSSAVTLVGETSPYGMYSSPCGKWHYVYGTTEDCFTDVNIATGLWENKPIIDIESASALPATITEIYPEMELPVLKVATAIDAQNLDHTAASTINVNHTPALYTRSGGFAQKSIGYTPTVMSGGAIQFKFESIGDHHIDYINLKLTEVSA